MRLLHFVRNDGSFIRNDDDVTRNDKTKISDLILLEYKYKKAKYLDNYEEQKGKMGLEEIKKFLSVQASFAGHVKHANSYNLIQKVGVIDEKNPFDYDRT